MPHGVIRIRETIKLWLNIAVWFNNKTLFIHDNLIKCTFDLPKSRDC